MSCTRNILILNKYKGELNLYKRRKFDNVILAVMLFALSGASLAYNLYTAESGDVAVSLSELVSTEYTEASAISEYAAANLMNDESIAVDAAPIEPPRSYELLDPIVVPPC